MTTKGEAGRLQIQSYHPSLFPFLPLPFLTRFCRSTCRESLLVVASAVVASLGGGKNQCDPVWMRVLAEALDKIDAASECVGATSGLVKKNKNKKASLPDAVNMLDHRMLKFFSGGVGPWSMNPPYVLCQLAGALLSWLLGLDRCACSPLAGIRGYPSSSEPTCLCLRVTMRLWISTFAQSSTLCIRRML